jgi:PAS domain S-box-containing protein
MAESTVEKIRLESLPVRGVIDRNIEEAALEIILKTHTYTGASYFEHLTERIAEYFGINGVYLTELALDFERVDLVAYHQDRAVHHPVDFSRSAACDDVIERGSVVEVQDAGKHYRFDDQLKTLRAEGFVGIVIRAASNDPIGALLLIHRTPLPEASFIEAVLQQLAPRIGSELERRQHELSLRRDYTRLRVLTDRARDVFFYVQLIPAPEVQYISPAIESLFELPPEAFHANPEYLFEMLETDDRASFEESLLAGSEEPLVARVRLPSGGTRWVEYRDFAIRDEANQLTGVGGTIRDVTKRVIAEEALETRDRYLRDLLIAIPDTLLLLRADGEVLDYVPGEVNTGLGNPEEIKGRHIKDLMSPAIVGALERTIRATSRSHRVQCVQFEVPGDQPRLHDVRCLPFGESAVLLVLRDLTAQKWFEGEEERQRFREEVYDRVETHTSSNAYGLTHREMAVLSLVVEGMADKQIADMLGISTYTVNKHVGNVLGKMNAVSRTEAGVRAIREGLLLRDKAKEPTAIRS